MYAVARSFLEDEEVELCFIIQLALGREGFIHSLRLCPLQREGLENEEHHQDVIMVDDHVVQLLSLKQLPNRRNGLRPDDHCMLVCLRAVWALVVVFDPNVVEKTSFKTAS